MNRKAALIDIPTLCLLLVAGTARADVPPPTERLGSYATPDEVVVFERPDFLEPKHLSACELRALGGPWTSEEITVAERELELTELRATLASVRKACAEGRGTVCYERHRRCLAGAR